jgi:3-phytase
MLMAMIAATLPAAAGRGSSDRTVRFATFNASLNRANPGQLIDDLSTPANTQARNVAEVIQRTRPDVLLINEFDFHDGNVAVDLFQENYLSSSIQTGRLSIGIQASFCR